MYLLRKEQKYLIIPLIVMSITWLVWYKQEDIHTDAVLKESMSDNIDDLVKINDLSTECRVPDKENPFMNPTLADYGSDKPPPPKSCPSYNNKGVQRRVEELFNEDLLCDQPSNWLGQMSSIVIPDCDIIELYNYLKLNNIEVPIMEWNNKKILRVSIQAYNDKLDIIRLIKYLKLFF